MIQDSIRSARYPFSTDVEKRLAPQVQVTPKGGSEDQLSSGDIAVEVRVQNFYVLTNYVSGISHLPGLIEADVIESFKMICRRFDRLDASGSNNNNNDKFVKLKKL
jgi:hypothetical protein